MSENESLRRPERLQLPVNLVVLGVDPGLAAMGLAVVSRSATRTTDQPVLKMATVVRTEKATAKARTKLRATNDDLARYLELVGGLEAARLAYPIYAVGVEAYHVAPGGGAHKTAMVYGGTIFWARTRDLHVEAFLPGDLKRRFCKKLSASKEDVGTALCDHVIGLAGVLEATPKGLREHICDATGHAVLMLEDRDKIHRQLGFGS